MTCSSPVPPYGTIHLPATVPARIAAAFGFLGWSWDPRPHSELTGRDAGLYMYVAGAEDAPLPLWVTLPVAYGGIGSGAEGVVGRLLRELGWVALTAFHGHGRTMALLRARPVAGPVAAAGPVDLGWLDTHLGAERGADARRLLAAAAADPLRLAEKLAIRFALHDAGATPPVNSQFAGAWNPARGNASLVDDLAWAMAQELHAQEAATTTGLGPTA